MKTVLLVAELGAGLGHVAPLLLVGERIHRNWSGRRPVRVLLVTADPAAAKAAFPESPVRVVAAPQATPKLRLASHTASYGDILTLLGYGQQSLLAPAVAAWDDLFALLKPDLLVADHSPTACLAARGAIPVIAIGSGYTLPPDNMPLFPSLLRGVSPPMAQTQILASANAVLTERGRPPLARLPEIFVAEQRAVFTLPMLDPYGPLRREPLLGTYHGGLAPMPPPDKPRIFVYAGADPERMDAMVQVLGRVNVPVSAYFGAREFAAARFLQNRGGEIHVSLPAIADVLAGASLVLSHGGAGLANAALTAGRPQIVLPIHAESRLTAGRIEALGTGLYLEKDIDERLGEAVETVLGDDSYRVRAEALAGKIASMGLPEDPVGRVVQGAIDLLR